MAYSRDMSIYMDYNATTPILPRLKRDFFSFLGVDGNPSSHYARGREAKEVLSLARERIGALIGQTSGELVFTGSGTESNNMVLKSILWRMLHSKGPAHIVSTMIEHPCVLETLKWVQTLGVEVTLLPVDSEGLVSPETLKQALRPDTCLVSIMMANNETGGLTGIGDLIPIVKERGILFHSDCVQAVGRVSVSVTELGLDFATFSAHKFYGVKGVGALYCRDAGLLDTPLLHGGPQERGLRAGTESVPAIAIMGAAAEWVRLKGLEEMERVRDLRDRLWCSIQDSCSTVVLNTPLAHSLPNTLNVSFPGVSSEGLIMRLDLEGVAVSSGSACSTGTTEESHVLKAMGCPHLDSAIRFSLGVLNTEEEVDFLVDLLVQLLP